MHQNSHGINFTRKYAGVQPSQGKQESKKKNKKIDIDATTVIENRNSLLKVKSRKYYENEEMMKISKKYDEGNKKLKQTKEIFKTQSSLYKKKRK